MLLKEGQTKSHEKSKRLKCDERRFEIRHPYGLMDNASPTEQLKLFTDLFFPPGFASQQPRQQLLP